MMDCWRWGQTAQTIDYKPRTAADWDTYLDKVCRLEGTCRTWASVHTHLCTSNKVFLKPSQLNIYMGSLLHIHKLVSVGLHFGAISDEWIEEKHYVNKIYLPLCRLFRSLSQENRKGAKGVAAAEDEQDGGRAKEGDNLRRANVGDALLKCHFKVELQREMYFESLVKRFLDAHPDFDVVPSIHSGSGDDGPTLEEYAATLLESAPSADPRRVDADFPDSDDAPAAEGSVSRVPSKFTARECVSVGTTPHDKVCSETGRTGLEVRVLHNSGLMRIVRTDIPEKLEKKTGSLVQWEVELSDIYAVQVCRHETDAKLAVAMLTLAAPPAYLVRRFDLGPRKWRGGKDRCHFLPGLHATPSLRIVANADRLRRAFGFVAEDWGGDAHGELKFADVDTHPAPAWTRSLSEICDAGHTHDTFREHR
jgi:hypothetical protein